MRRRVVEMFGWICREQHTHARRFLGISGCLALMLLCQGCGFMFPAGTDHNLPLINGALSRGGVHTLTGSFSQVFTAEAVDLAIDGRGPSPLLVRTYNSNDTRVSPLGPGWTHGYATHLDTAFTVLVGPQGRSDSYGSESNGTFDPPPGITTTLRVDHPSGGDVYTATQADQTTWTFNAGGFLTQVADRYGNTSTLSPGTGKPTTISDPAGRGSIALTYDSCYTGRLCSVADWAGRTVTYAYFPVGDPVHRDGMLRGVTDRNGQTTTFDYQVTPNPDGTFTSRLSSITDANNNTFTNHYDAQGRVDYQIDQNGNRTDYDWTQAGVGKVTYPATSFGSNFRAIETDTYDGGFLSQHQAQPAAGQTLVSTYTYDGRGFPSSVTDPNQNTTTLCYDFDYSGAETGTRGDLARIIAPPVGGGNPAVSLSKLDTHHNTIQTIKPRGVHNGASVTCGTDLTGAIDNASPPLFGTDFTFDASGAQLLAASSRYSDPEAGLHVATTKYEYGDLFNLGRITRVIPPPGNTGATPDYSFATTLTYYGAGDSQAGMLHTATDALNNITSYTYDSVGRRTSMADPTGQVWQYSYDNEDRLRFTRAPAPSGGGAQLVTEQRYDAVGNPTVQIDANGQVTTYAYDGRNQLREQDESPSAWTDPANPPSQKIATTYQYDLLGNLTRITRAAGDSNNERATDYTYDGQNNVRTEVQYPNWPSTSGALTTQYAYDLAGNQTSRVDPLNLTTNFAHDALNRLSGITYSDGQTPNVAYTYDADGNRATMTTGSTQTAYVYDELDRLLTVTTAGSSPVGYRYDLAGNRSKLIYPDGTAVSYTYDKRNELSSTLDWANRGTSYLYFPDGQIKQATNVNGTTATYAYDNDRRLVDVLNQHGTTTLSRHTYTLDPIGNRTEVAETLAQLAGGPSTPTTTYAYDRMYRLTGAAPSDVSTGATIANVTAAKVGPTSVTISWTSSVPTTSQVKYGSSPSYGSSTSPDQALATNHSVTVSGLTAATTYNYAVVSVDALGNQTTSNNSTFATLSPQVCPCSIFGSSSAPLTPSDPSTSPVELGVKFRTDTAGFITGIRFYKGPTNTGTHQGSLWTSSGTQLATATFTGESAVGWQQVSFANPVAVSANTTYVASYFAPNGGFAADRVGLVPGSDNAPLHALPNGADGANGVYASASNSSFPSQTFDATNYWVDVQFRTSATPSVTDVRAINIASNTGTISWATDSPADSVVDYGPTTSYGSSTTATPAPVTSHSVLLSGLSPSATYHYRVRSTDSNGDTTTSGDFAFSTLSCQYCACSLWSGSAGPVNASQNDTTATEVGVKLRSDTAGYVTGIRFYKGSANTGPHVGSLWSATGTLLARATFVDETATGWQQVNFSEPVAVQANTTYVASYHTSVGHYAADQGAFASTGVDNAPLHALASGVDGGNGVYAYAPSSAFPTQTFNATNYWVDVVFGTAAPPTLTNLQTSSVTTAGATVTWSSDVQADSQVEYGTTTSYGSSTQIDVTLGTTHSVALAGLQQGTTYHYRVKSRGSAGYRTVSSDATFVTSSPSCPCTVWSASAAPANPAQDDSASVEVGTRLRSDASGYITGVRFYKGAGNTGTHVGSLWNNSGTLLAQATFSSETASGWQEVTFSTPVAISSGTTYVASYHASSGHYAADQNYFSSYTTSSGPLHELADGTDGPNGVFVYAATSAFPSQSFNRTNYWVDVVFATTLSSGSSGISASSYSYDAVGNRLTANSTTATYDRADRITSTGYRVNDAGNLVQRGPDALAYDQANRLTCYRTGATACTPASATSTYTYDGDGKRISATTAGATTTYVYDVSTKLPMLLTDGTRKYVYGNGLAYETDMAGNVQSVPLRDGLGSVRALTNTSGALIQTYRTDPYGMPTATQGSTTQPFTFTGEQSDPTGLVYLRARMYDPTLGRFLQRDAVAHSGPGVIGWNRFAYAGANPVMMVDPSGLDGDWRDTLSQNCKVPNPFQPTNCAFPSPGPNNTLMVTFPKVWNPFENGEEASAAFDALDLPALNEVLGGGGTSRDITEASISRIEKHLQRIEGNALNDPANQAMIERLRNGMRTTWDTRFYEHEMLEADLMDQGMSERDAHLATLERQGIKYEPGYESNLYHPDVIRQFPDQFNSAAWPK